mgnify:CR=1 FL=1
MEHTKAALKRQADPRWLLVVVALFGLTIAGDYLGNSEQDSCSPPGCETAE